MFPQSDLAELVLRVFGQATHEVMHCERFGDLVLFLIGKGVVAHRQIEVSACRIVKLLLTKLQKRQEKSCRLCKIPECSAMNVPDAVAKNELAEWLKRLGKSREWLATTLHVSEGVVNQWLSPRGVFPLDRQVAVKMLLQREENAPLIGDPEGNLLAFTIEEFEKIEETRQRLHYETRPALYRDAILAYIEADDVSTTNTAPNVLPFDKAAETTTPPPVTEERREVVYPKPSRKPKP